jgi:hypothetical protein
MPSSCVAQVISNFKCFLSFTIISGCCRLPHKSDSILVYKYQINVIIE